MNYRINKNRLSILVVFIASILFVNVSCRKDFGKIVHGKMNNDTSNIIYTDVNPDISIFAALNSAQGNGFNEYYIDLDKDGIADFEFLAYVATPESRAEPNPPMPAFAAVSIDCNLNGSDNEVLIKNQFVAALDSLSTIDSLASAWASNTQRLIVSPMITWNPDTAFVGLKLIKNNEAFYGWVRVANVSTGFPALRSSMTIIDYAYNSVPNQPISAGQTK